jgi:GlpG protein
MRYILLLGPLLEEKYGSRLILVVILITAGVTGILNFILFPDAALLGASGVVFAFIILSSITGFNSKEIPLTFILVAVIYLGQQIYSGLFIKDNIANFAHIIGGLVGAILGFALNRRD